MIYYKSFGGDNMSESRQEQNILIYNKSKISITGIRSVDSFDESFISMTTTDEQRLVVEGNGLTVSDVNLDSGKVDAVGNISGVFYESTVKNSTGILSALFRRR